MKEINEVLKYLSCQNDYLIWAGVAQYAYTGIPHSPDLDIFVKEPEQIRKIADDVMQLGWEVFHEKNEYVKSCSLKKNEATFDIVYTEYSAKILFQKPVTKALYSYNVNFIAPEALFLTKMGQITWPERSEAKKARDSKCINTLRETLDLVALSQLLSVIPVHFWKKGYL